MKKKRRLNVGAVWNLLSLVAGSYFVIEGFYMVTIRPFFTHELLGFTWLGLIIFVTSIIVVFESGEYLYERLHK